MVIRNYKRLFIFLTFICAFPFIGKSQQLTGKTITINVNYSALACACAQWSVETKQITNDSSLHIYLEPANNKLIYADNLWDGEHLPLKLKLTGQYYIKEGYPKNYQPGKGNPAPAKVFRYSMIVIIQK